MHLLKNHPSFRRVSLTPTSQRQAGLTRGNLASCNMANYSCYQINTASSGAKNHSAGQEPAAYESNSFPSASQSMQKDYPGLLQSSQLPRSRAPKHPLTQPVLDSLRFQHFGSIRPPSPSTSDSPQCYININKIKPLIFPFVRQYQCCHFAGRGEKKDRHDDSLCDLRHVPRQSHGIRLCTGQS